MNPLVTAWLQVSAAFSETVFAAGQPAPRGKKLEGVGKSPLSLTPEQEKANTWEQITSYNNYYEFGTDKDSPSLTAGKLKIVSFDNPSALVAESGAKLRADGAAPVDVAVPSVRAGSLEQSNVSLVNRVAELTGVTRSFEALQKAMSLMMNDIDGRAIEQLGRIR